MAECKKGSCTSDLRLLLESGDHADMTLVVGEAQLPAHSVILAARSPVFSAMFHSDMLEANSRQIEITGIEEAVVKQMLSFIYTDTTPELAGVAAELLVAADKYELPLLKERCEQQMMRDLSVDNAAAAATVAVIYRCPGLRSAAVKFIAGHPKVMATVGWAQLLRNHAEAAVEVCEQVATTTPQPEKVATTPPQPEKVATTPPQSEQVATTTPQTEQVATTTPQTEQVATTTPQSEQVATTTPQSEQVATTPQSEQVATTTPQSEQVATTTPQPEQVATTTPQPEQVATTTPQPEQVATTTPQPKTATEGTSTVVQPEVRFLPQEIRQKIVTKLINAARCGRAQEVWALLTAGAPKDARDVGGNTSLHLAVTNGHASAVRLLLDGGLDVNAVNNKKQTPLHLAAQGGNVNVVWMLVAAGARVDAQDDQRKTPLHVAAQRGDSTVPVQVVSALLLAGARRDIKDTSGRTPESIANNYKNSPFTTYSDLQ